MVSCPAKSSARKRKKMLQLDWSIIISLLYNMTEDYIPVQSSNKLKVKYLDPYSPTFLKNILCLFLQDLANLNAIQILIG